MKAKQAQYHAIIKQGRSSVQSTNTQRTEALLLSRASSHLLLDDNNSNNNSLQGETTLLLISMHLDHAAIRSQQESFYGSVLLSIFRASSVSEQVNSLMH